MFLYLINPLPELVPAAIGVGDHVTGETIEYPGDVDSFTVMPAPTGFVNYVFRHPGSPGGALRVTWPLAFPPGSQTACYPDGTAPRSCATGTHPIPMLGEWFRVGADFSYRGGYELEVYGIDTLPEGTSPSIVLGQAVQSSLDPVGDIDHFTFSVGSGELFDMEFSGGNECSCDSFTFLFLRNGIHQSGYSGAGPAWRVGRFAFPDTGIWTRWSPAATMGA